MLWTLLLPLLQLSLPPDCGRNTSEIAEAYGYLHETHTVTTQDGYILTLFRLPGRKGEDLAKGPKKVPIVIQPGIAADADNIVIGGPPYAPGFYFVDQGFDVWIANQRGSTYSRKHVKYSPDDVRFWNFTFEDQGLYDQPAYLDYVSRVTGFAKVHFIGHSQGGTQMLAALTLDPAYYAKRLLSFVALGSPARLDTSRSLLVQGLYYTNYMEISEFLGVYEFARYNPFLGSIVAYIGLAFPGLGAELVRLSCDEYPETVNLTRVAIYMARYPQGTSTKSFKHLFQSYQTKGFYRYRERESDPWVPYDFGKVPPVPIALIGGDGDMMCAPEAFLWLHNEFAKYGKSHYFRIFPKLGHVGMLTPNKHNTEFLLDVYGFLKSAETDQSQSINL